MTVQTQEYLGRGTRKKGKQWLLIKPHYDPFTDGLTLGGVTELEPGEARIGVIKPGTTVMLNDRPTLVVSHANYMTTVSYVVSRSIKTKKGDEAEINSSHESRVPSSVVVLTKVPKSKPQATKASIAPTRSTGVGSKSQADLDVDAKKLVEKLLLAGGMKYSEIHKQVMTDIPGWSRSLSWVSNIAFYMRKDGRLKNGKNA